MPDKFEDLRNYVAVIENGGVNAAATALGIAKSAVSRRLGELEDRLGTPLIVRSTRKFEPTSVGRHYYERAKEILASLETLDGSVSSKEGSAGIRLVIAANPSLSVLVAAGMAPPLRDNAALVINIVDPQSSDTEAADIWVGATPPISGAFERHAAGHAAKAVVGSPALLEDAGRPKTFSELRAHDGIAVAANGNDGWDFGSEGTQSPRIVLLVPDEASAIAAAMSGAGLARVAAHLAAPAIDAGQLEQVLASKEPSAAPVSIWLRKGADISARRLADHLISTVFG